MAEKMPVVVGLCSASAPALARGVYAGIREAYRVERLDVRVPDVVGQLEQAREDAGEARPPRRRLLGRGHGASVMQGAGRVQMDSNGGMFSSW